MKLHALDLSSNVGSAILVRGRPPLFQTLRLSGDLASMLGRFSQWLDDMHAVHRFDGVAWERPIITPKDKVDKLELLYGLVGVAYAFAGRRNLPWHEVTIDEAKFTLVGAHTTVDAGGKRRKVDKTDMVAAAMKLGWKVATDHEADAGAVGICAYERLWPKREAA